MMNDARRRHRARLREEARRRQKRSDVIWQTGIVLFLIGLSFVVANGGY